MTLREELDALIRKARGRNTRDQVTLANFVTEHAGQLVPLPEVEELCIIYNQVLLNQPEDQRDQTKAMQAIINHMKGKDQPHD